MEKNYFDRIKLIISILAFAIFGVYFIYRGIWGNVLTYSQYKEAIINKNITNVHINGDKSWFFETVGSRFKRTTVMRETLINNQDDFANFLNDHNVKLLIDSSLPFLQQIEKIMRVLFGIFLLIISIMGFISLFIHRK